MENLSPGGEVSLSLWSPVFGAALLGGAGDAVATLSITPAGGRGLGCDREHPSVLSGVPDSNICISTLL